MDPNQPLEEGLEFSSTTNDLLYAIAQKVSINPNLPLPETFYGRNTTDDLLFFIAKNISADWESITNNPFEVSSPDDFLAADYDFSGFALLLGRSGGQTIYGGTGSGESLKLFGNTVDANATVYFTPNLSYYVNISNGLNAPWLISSYGVISPNFRSLGDVYNHLGDFTRAFYFYTTYYRTGLITKLNSSGQEFSGLADFYVKNGRNTSTVSPNGFNFEIEAGGGTVGRTNVSGGNLLLKAGKTTGTGTSSVLLQAPAQAGESGTSDNSFVTLIEASGLGGGKIGFWGEAPATRQSLSVYANQDFDADYIGEGGLALVSELNDLKNKIKLLEDSYFQLFTAITNTTLISKL